MSHFFTLVLVEDDGREIRDQVEDLLSPYDENIEVAPYERVCSCVGRQARNEARAQAESELGTMDELRASFKEAYPELWPLDPFDKQYEDAWKTHVKPLSDRESALFESHPDKDKPDPTCGFYEGARQSWWAKDAKEGERYEDESGCGGTGTYISQYSPSAKWDWWEIGGRWTGELDSKYDPRKDPRNIVPCSLCDGTGDRPGWVTYVDVASFASGRQLAPLNMDSRPFGPKFLALGGIDRQFKDDWARKCNGCNGCNGTGKTVKWSLEPFSGDVIPVAEIPEGITPFALVTPDGDWYERGSMGWWACVSEEKEEDDWKDEVKSLLSAYQDCIAVVCDCHI